MRDGSYECQIEDDPIAVSAFVADLRNDAKWRQEIVAVEVTGGVPGQAGAEYVEDVTWEGLHARTSLRVTEVQPGSRVSLTTQDPGIASCFDYSFQPSAEGTHITLSLSLETMGALRLMEPFMWGLITRWIERDLCDLGKAMARHNPT